MRRKPIEAGKTIRLQSKTHLNEEERRRLGRNTLGFYTIQRRFGKAVGGSSSRSPHQRSLSLSGTYLPQYSCCTQSLVGSSPLKVWPWCKWISEHSSEGCRTIMLSVVKICKAYSQSYHKPSPHPPAHLILFSQKFLHQALLLALFNGWGLSPHLDYCVLHFPQLSSCCVVFILVLFFLLMCSYHFPRCYHQLIQRFSFHWIQFFLKISAFPLESPVHHSDAQFTSAGQKIAFPFLPTSLDCSTF